MTLTSCTTNKSKPNQNWTNNTRLEHCKLLYTKIPVPNNNKMYTEQECGEAGTVQSTHYTKVTFYISGFGNPSVAIWQHITLS